MSTTAAHRHRGQAAERHDEHEVDERGKQLEQDLEDDDVGDHDPAHETGLEQGSPIPPRRLEHAVGPAEPLPRELADILRHFGQGNGAFLDHDAVTLPKNAR